MKIYIFLIIVIVFIYCYYKSYHKHEFWDTQPVSRKSIFFSNNDGIIMKSKYFKIDYNLDLYYSWNNITDLSLFKEFLHKNYSKYEIYDEDYLKWILNMPYIKNFDRNKLNISLLYKNKLIATITGRPIVLKINNNIVKGFYVDFLCISKEHQGKKLVPKLINKMLSEWKKYKLDIHIFKIDFKPLPFDHIGNFNYYYYDISKSNKKSKMIKNIIIKELDENMIESAYKYFYENIQKYKLYQILTINEFRYHFLPNRFIKTFIILDNNNNIDGFITFTEMKYKNPKGDGIVKCIELTYFIINTTSIYVIYNFINMFKEYDYLIFLDAMKNEELINILHPDRGHKTYYHLYNYITNIKKDDIGLMII